MATLPAHQRPVVETLEARILHSADALPLGGALGDGAHQWLQSSATETAVPRGEIVFVDSAVPDAASLLADLQAQAAAGRPIQIVLLDAGQDGLAQITHVLAGRSDLGAVHVLAHGSDGALQLGKVRLDDSTLLARAGEIAGWSAALSADADLLLYGCDVAQSAAGQRFVRDLAALTGADVAASTDLTGAAAAGGNWTLEFGTGHIDAALAIDSAARQAWSGTLAVIFGSESSGDVSSLVTSYSFSHNVNSGSDRLLLVQVVLGNSASAVTAIDFNGAALSFVSAHNSPSNHVRIELWARVAPPVASGTVTLTLASASRLAVGATSYTGVDQTTPLGTPVKTAGNDSTPLAVVASSSGAMVVDIVGAARVSSWGSGAGQTENFVRNQGTGPTNLLALSTREAGAASVTMDHSFVSADPNWAAIAVQIREVGAANVAPLATNLNAAEGYTEDTPLNLSDIVISDVDSANVTAMLTLSAPGAGSLNIATSGAVTSSYIAGTGVWSASGAIADVNALLAALTFTPTLDFNAGFSIATSVSDGVAAPVTGSKAFTGTAVNDPPVNLVPGVQSTAVDTPLVFSGAGGNLVATSDVDAAPAPVQVTLAASNGTLSLPWPSVAATAAGAEFRVNTTTADTQTTWDGGFYGATTSDFSSPRAVASDPAGNFVVTWSSKKQDGDGWGVFAQRYSAAGVAQGAEFAVNATTAKDQAQASVAIDDAGNFVIVWSSQDQDGDGWGVYGQRYNAAGTAQGGEFRINSTTAKDQLGASVAMDGTGNFVVSWSSKDQDGNGWGIYAKRFDAAGAAQGGEFRVNGTSAKDQTASSVAVAADGRFVVTWSSQDQDGNSWGVYARRFDAAGLAQGGEFRVNTMIAKEQQFSSVAIDANGNFVVAWSSNDQDGDGYGVYAQRYSAAGAALGAEFRVNVTTAKDQIHPSVAMDADGDFVVSWSSDAQDGDKHGVYARQYAASGVARGGETRVNTTTAGEQGYSSVAMDARGGFVAMWSGAGVGDAEGVMGRRYAVPSALTFAAGDGTRDATMTFTGTLAQVNAALDGLVFTPNAGYNGLATLTITTHDLGNTGSGGARSDTDVVNINVGTGNVSPTLTLTGGALSYTENAPATPIDPGATVSDADSADFAGGQFAAFLSGGGTPSDRLAIRHQGTAVGEIGVAGANVSYNFGAGALVIGTWSGGSDDATPLIVALNGNSNAAAVQALLRNITFEDLSEDPSPLDRTVQFELSDGDGGTSPAASRAISVLAENDAPQATNLSAAQGYTEDTPLALTPIVISDVDSATVTATLTLSAPGAGSLNIATSGAVTSTYDVGSGIWSASGAIADVNALLAALTFTPTLDFNAGFSIATSVSDGVAAPVTGSKLFTGTAVNDPPVLVTNSPLLVPEEATRTITPAYLRYSDVDHSPAQIRFTLTDLPDNGASVRLNGSALGLGGSFTQDDINNNRVSVRGSDDGSGNSFRFTVSDGVATLPEATFSLTGQPVNDAPNGADNTIVIDEDVAHVFGTADFGFSDPNDTPPNAFMSVRIASLPVAGQLTNNGVAVSAGQFIPVADLVAGRLVFTPAANGNGAGHASFTFQVRDNGGTANGGIDLDPVPRTITFNVTAVNDPPVIVGGATAAFNVAENSTAVTTVVATDVDGPAILYSIVGGDDSARFTIDAGSGALRFVVPPNFEAPTDVGANNVYDLVVRASDGTSSDDQAIAVAVTAVTEALLTTGVQRVNAVTADLQETSVFGRGSPRAVAMSPAGNYVVVWSSQNQDGDGWGVYGQRFDNAGAKVGGEFRVNTETAGDQAWASVAMAVDGRFVVSWTSANQDGSAQSVYAQRYNADGSVAGAEFRVHTTPSGSQFNSAVAMDANGNFVVVWQGNGPGDGDGIFGRRFAADGSALDGVEFRVSTDLGRPHEGPSVSMNASGAFAVAWNNDLGAQLRRYDAAGAALDAAEVTGGLGAAAGKASVALADSGAVVLVWRETTLDHGIFLQRYNAAGAAAGGRVGVNSTIVFDQTDPSITVDGNGNFIVAWEGFGPGDGSGVFAQKFNAAGARVGGEFRLNSTTAGTQHQVSLAMLDLDNFVAVWSGQGPVDSAGVFVRQYGTLSFAPVITSHAGAENVALTVAENGTAVSTVTATDADLPAQTLSYSISGDDAARFVIGASSGVLSFAVAPDFEGPTDVGADNVYDLIVTVSDGTLTASQAFAVSVTNVNDNAPVAAPAAATGAEDLLLAITLSASDVDSGVASFTLSTLPANGLLYLDAARTTPILTGTAYAASGNALTLYFLPAADWHGSAGFSFVATDDFGLVSAAQNATLTVTPENDPPVLTAASLSIAEGQTLTLSAANFGIADPDDTAFTFTISALSGGTFQLSSAAGVPITAFSSAQLAGGLVQFVDDGDEFAPGFSVRVNDGDADSNLLAATIGLTPVNDPPVLTAASLSIAEGQTLTLSAANFGIADPDDTAFTFTISALSGGTFQLSSAAGVPITAFSSAQLAGGLVQFVDDGDEFAPGFSVRVNDGDADSNLLAATIGLTPVNDPPVLTAASLSIAEGQTLTLSAANFGIADPDDTAFTFTISALSGGTFQLSSAAGVPITAFSSAQLAGGLVQFVDDGDEFAPGFSVRVNDGDADSNLLAATIGLTPVNDPPVLTAASLSIAEGQTLTLSAANFGIADPDDTAFTFTISALSGGTFQLSSAAGVPITAFSSAQLAGGLVQFVDDGDEFAPGFSVRVNDGDADSNLLAATIGLTPVNDPPVLTAASLSIAEGQTLTLSAANFGIADPDDTAFTFTISALSGGTFQLSSAAGVPITAFSSAQLAGGLVQFVDDGDEFAPGFSVRVNDGDADSNLLAATIGFTRVNDAPTGLPLISGTPTEDQVLTADLAAIADLDGLGAFNVQWHRDGVAIGGANAASYTLGDADVGRRISLRVSYVDGQGRAESLVSAPTARVANVNDAPSGLPLISGTPAEDQVLTADLAAIADLDGLGAFNVQWHRDGVAIGGANAASYTLGDADVGRRISLRVSYVDGQGRAESLVSAPTAPIANVNDAPTGLPLISGTPTEDQVLTADLAAIADLDGLGAFNVQWHRDGVAIGGANAASYTLGDADVGRRISLRVSYVDGQGRAESLDSARTAPIANLNDRPTAVGSIADQGATQGLAFRLVIPAGVFADVDPGDRLVLSATRASGAALPGWLHFDAATGSFSGTPANADVGVTTLRLRATDSGGATAFVDFTLTVANVNDAPRLQAPLGEYLAAVDAPLRLTLPAATFIDVDVGDRLSYTATLANGDALPAWLSFDPATRSFSGTPRLAAAGMVQVRVVATDLSAAAAEMHFALIVLVAEPVSTGSNLPPAAPAPTVVVDDAPGGVDAVATSRPATLEPPSHTQAWLSAAGELPSLAPSGAGPSGLKIVVDPAPVRHSDHVLAPVALAELRQIELSQLLQLLQGDDLQRRLETLQRNLIELGEDSQRSVLASTLAVTSGLSIGYVVWLVRGGILVSTMLSALPAWQMVDPLPVLAASGAARPAPGVAAADEAEVERLFDAGSKVDEPSRQAIPPRAPPGGPPTEAHRS